MHAESGERHRIADQIDFLSHAIMDPDDRRIAFTSGHPQRELWVMENFLPED